MINGLDLLVVKHCGSTTCNSGAPPDEYHKEVMKLKPADRAVQQLWGWAV